MVKTFEVEFTERYTIRVEADTQSEAIERANEIPLEDWEFEEGEFEATDISGMSTLELLDWLSDEKQLTRIYDATKLNPGEPTEEYELSSDGIYISGAGQYFGAFEYSNEQFLKGFKNDRWFLSHV